MTGAVWILAVVFYRFLDFLGDWNAIWVKPPLLSCTRLFYCTICNYDCYGVRSPCVLSSWTLWEWLMPSDGIGLASFRILACDVVDGTTTLLCWFLILSNSSLNVGREINSSAVRTVCLWQPLISLLMAFSTYSRNLWSRLGSFIELSSRCTDRSSMKVLTISVSLIAEAFDSFDYGID